MMPQICTSYFLSNQDRQHSEQAPVLHSVPIKFITLWINLTRFVVGIIAKIIELVYSSIQLNISKLFVYFDEMLDVQYQIR